MADKLLVRIYNVGLGDCIYVQVPDDNGRDGKVHILIDCGNKFGEMEVLKKAIGDVETHLPLVDPADPNSTKRLLDLLVVTHPHEDHHKGFEPAFFKNIRIQNLWLSPAFCELDDEIGTKPHQAINGNQNLRSLQAAARDGLNRLVNVSPAGETKEILEEVLQSLSKADAITVLNGGSKDNQRLDVVSRRYVSANPKYETQTHKDLETVAGWAPFIKADLTNLFHDPETKIKILAPRGKLDTYLSAPKPNPVSHLALSSVQLEGNTENLANDLGSQARMPRNISIQDFDRLRAGIQSNILAAAAELGHAINNLSVVLLLEWKGYRLLFPGDAEWEGSKIEIKDSNNGSWNVMWNDDQDGELKKKIDFLKVGHHGSENATPWARTEKGEDHPISVILNSLLPEPQQNQTPTAWAVVSTQETQRWVSIPDPQLLRAIGKRVVNGRLFGKQLQFNLDTRKKYEIYTEPSLLPDRTDQYDPEKLKQNNERQPLEYIDVFFPPS